MDGSGILEGKAAITLVVAFTPNCFFFLFPSFHFRQFHHRHPHHLHPAFITNTRLVFNFAPVIVLISLTPTSH